MKQRQKKSISHNTTLLPSVNTVQLTTLLYCQVSIQYFSQYNFTAKCQYSTSHSHSTTLLPSVNTVLLCFSAISGTGLAYLSELLHVNTPSRTLRSSSDTRMLKIQQYKRKSHGFRTFSCFGPHIWNSLPQDTAQPFHLLKPN